MSYKKQFFLIINLLLGSFLLWYTWIFLVRNYDVVNPGGDLGEFINNSFRTLNGDRPYKDFWLLFPPVEVLFPALLYKIFGVSINVILALRATVLILMSVTGFALSWSVFKNITASLTISFLLIFCGNPDVYFLPQILSALFLVQFFKTCKWGWLIAGGLAMGCAILFRFYQAAPMVIASFVSIWFYKRERRLRRLFAYTASIFIIIIPFIIYYSGIFTTAVYALLVDCVAHNHAMALNYFFRLKKDFTDIQLYTSLPRYRADPYYSLNLFNLWLTAIFHIMVYIFPLITLLLVVLNYRRLKQLNPFDKTVFVFFAAWSILFFPYPFERGEANRVLHILPPYYFVLFFLLLKVNNITRGGYLYKAIIIASISVLLIKSILQVYFVRDFNSLPKYAITSEHGSYRTTDRQTAVNDSGLLRFITSNTFPGEYIFSTAWDGPPVYLLTGRRNPTYYDSMIDVVVRPTDKKQQQIINDLQAHHTRLIILEPGLIYDGMPSRSYVANCKVLNTFVHTHYSLKKVFGDLEVYILNE